MDDRLIRDDDLNCRARLGETQLMLDLALADARCPIASSKFGPDSAVFLHLVTRRVSTIPIVHVETGYDTVATRDFVDDLADRLGLNLHVVRPEDHVAAIPPALDDPDHASFVERVKLEPFRRALARLGADVWLSSIRRYQSAYRQGEPAFRTLGSGVLKVSPLLGWSASDVSRYAAEHDLPTGPDAFDPTKGEPSRECGLHLAVGG